MPCDFRAFCSRPAGHRGHHGGWRPRIQAVAANPWTHTVHGSAFEGTGLTGRELRVLAEYAQHASVKDVADCTGLAEQSVKNALHNAHRRTGVTSTVEVFGLLGWLTVPSYVGTLHAGRAA